MENQNPLHVRTDKIPPNVRFGIGKAFFEAYMSFEEKNTKGKEDGDNTTDGHESDTPICGALQDTA